MEIFSINWKKIKQIFYFEITVFTENFSAHNFNHYWMKTTIFYQEIKVFNMGQSTLILLLQHFIIKSNNNNQKKL